MTAVQYHKGGISTGSDSQVKFHGVSILRDHNIGIIILGNIVVLVDFNLPVHQSL